jgi:uncharacterized repeat protein (TIGR01451 family)/LPXTG-motif cell wall-anchored protein
MRLFHIRYWSLALGIFLITLAQIPFNAQASQSDSVLLAITPSAEPPTPVPPTAIPPTSGAATETPAVPTVPPEEPTTPPTADAATVVVTPDTNTGGSSGGGRPDPAIYKSANTSEAQIGDTVIFTLHLTNLGDSVARDVAVGDTVPSQFSIINASATRGNVSVDGQNVLVFVGDLAAGENIYITIEARVNDWVQASSVVNDVLVTTSSSGDFPGNNTSSTTIIIVQVEPTPTLEITPTPEPVAPSPTATPVPTLPPAGLPQTGGSDNNGLLISLLGLFFIGLSLVLYFYNHRANKQS